MTAKLIFQRGNLYTGYPFGVEADIGWFGSTELHGPFNGENDAHNYAVQLVLDREDVTNAKVVKIETPAVGRQIIETDEDRQVADAAREARRAGR